MLSGVARFVTKYRQTLRQSAFSALGAPLYRFGTTSFSQAGEDCILRFLFDDIGVPLAEVSYLDIGSRHPTVGSNTCLLYVAGARGVCVDADTQFLDDFRTMRPGDRLLSVGVVPDPLRAAPLHVMEGGGSTFDGDEAVRRSGMQGTDLPPTRTVPLMDVNSIIRQEFAAYPTFLAIDIEALDLPVLKSLDFAAFPIPVICAETCVFSTDHVRAKDAMTAGFLASKGYDVYADTSINTIFVRRDWLQRPRQPARAPR